MFSVPCQIGRGNGRVSSSHIISKTDTINVVPFEPEEQELVRRGIVLKYIPKLSQLTIIIRFRRVTGEARILPYLQSRGAIYQEEEEEETVWPLHSDTTILSSLINKIGLREANVWLKNGVVVSFDEAIADISNRI